MSGKAEVSQVAPIPQKRAVGDVGAPEIQPPVKKKKPSVKKKAKIHELQGLLAAEKKNSSDLKDQVAAEKKKSSDLANQVSQYVAQIGTIRRDCADQCKKEMQSQQHKYQELMKVQAETNGLKIARLTKELSIKSRDVEEGSKQIKQMKDTFKELFTKVAQDLGYDFVDIDDTSAAAASPQKTAASPLKTARGLRSEARP
eukprot:SAG11_NODE_4037_length_2094_cov_14.631579_2_plen_200_part_00